MTNQTANTICQRMDLIEAMTRSMRPVAVESMTDAGEWIARSFADEKTATHYEADMKRRSVQTRRVAG